MTTIHVVAIEKIAGRGHGYVRLYGYRTADSVKRGVEVAASVEDAKAVARTMIDFGSCDVEVDDHVWAHTMAPTVGQVFHD